MGSSGTGTFSDYPGSQGGRPGGNSGGGGGASGGKGSGGSGGGGGGSGGGGADQCAIAITGIVLEEVANAEYYEVHESVPRPGTKVQLRKTLVKRRVAVETAVKGEVVGYVPTAFNYLRPCMADGWEYSGEVEESSVGKLPKVKVNLSPTHED